MKLVPVDARRKDWPRLVSEANAEKSRKIEELEREIIDLKQRVLALENP